MTQSTRTLLENNFKRFFSLTPDSQQESALTETTPETSSTLTEQPINENQTTPQTDEICHQSCEPDKPDQDIKETSLNDTSSQPTEALSTQTPTSDETPSAPLETLETSQSEQKDVEQDELTQIYHSRQSELNKLGISSQQEWLSFLAQTDQKLSQNPTQTIQNMIDAYQLDKKALVLDLIKQLHPEVLSVAQKTLSQPYQEASQNPSLTSLIQKTAQNVEDLKKQQAEISKRSDFEKELFSLTPTGEMKYPHALSVRETLFNLYSTSPATPFSTLYENALWLTPKTRDLLISQRIDDKLKTQTQSLSPSLKASFSPTSHHPSTPTIASKTSQKTTRELLVDAMRRSGLL